jgi:hypothetical protein
VDATLLVDRGDQQQEIPVFGFPSTYRDFNTEKHRPPVPAEMFGNAIMMQPADPSTLQPPWNELEAHLLVGEGDDFPTLVWLNQVAPMQERK